MKLEEPHDRLKVGTFKGVFTGVSTILGGAHRGCQTGSAGLSTVTSGALELSSIGGIVAESSVPSALTTLAGRELRCEGPFSEQVW